MSTRIYQDCDLVFTIADDGVLNVCGTSGYVDLVQNGCDIPDVDWVLRQLSGYSGGGSGAGTSGYSGDSGYSGMGYSGDSGYSGFGESGYSGAHGQESYLTLTDTFIPSYPGYSGFYIQVVYGESGTSANEPCHVDDATAPADPYLGQLWIKPTDTSFLDGVSGYSGYSGGGTSSGGGGAYNLAPNPSFEKWDDGVSGIPTKWNIISTAVTERDTGEADGFCGSYAVKITSGGGGKEGLKFTFKKLKPSTQYAVSIRGKATAGDTAKIWTTGAAANLSVTTTSATFADVIGTFTTDATPTDVVIYIGSDNNGDIVWFDRLQVNEGSTAFSYSTNIHDETQFCFSAGSFLYPLSSWPEPDPANLAITDSTNMTTQSFVTGANTGVGFFLKIPEWAQQINFNMIWFMGAGGAAAENIVWALYTKEILDYLASGAWSSIIDFPQKVAKGAASRYQYNSYAIPIGAAGGEIALTNGETYLIEFLRDAVGGSDNVGDTAALI
jgi:hypothetical protein